MSVPCACPATQRCWPTICGRACARLCSVLRNRRVAMRILCTESGSSLRTMGSSDFRSARVIRRPGRPTGPPASVQRCGPVESQSCSSHVRGEPEPLTPVEEVPSREILAAGAV